MRDVEFSGVTGSNTVKFVQCSGVSAASGESGDGGAADPGGGVRRSPEGGGVYNPLTQVT